MLPAVNGPETRRRRFPLPVLPGAWHNHTELAGSRLILTDPSNIVQLRSELIVPSGDEFRRRGSAVAGGQTDASCETPLVTGYEFQRGMQVGGKQYRPQQRSKA